MVIERAGRLLPKLLDLGIAKVISDVGLGEDRPFAEDITLSDDDVTPITQAGAVMGSPPYMAPELWLSSSDATPRSDLYALAVVAYEAIAGRRPFNGSTLGKMAHAHRRNAVPPVGPAELDAFFARALAKVPEDRFASALELKRALGAAVGEDTVVELPRLPPLLRDLCLAKLPQPLAEAVAALDAARHPHQARDAVHGVTRAATRLLATLALAARAHVAVDATSGDLASVAEALRDLRRADLGDAEWLALARTLVAGFAARPQDHPIPPLVEAVGRLSALDAGPVGVGEWLAEAMPALARFLEGLAFLHGYRLVVVDDRDRLESWTGLRRPYRPTLEARGGLPGEGRALLVDGEGRPCLVLWPLVQIAPPTPGAAPEVFVFDGRGRHGARLAALPAGFQLEDSAIWECSRRTSCRWPSPTRGWRRAAPTARPGWASARTASSRAPASSAARPRWCRR